MKKILLVFLALFSIVFLGSCDKVYFKDGNIKTMIKASDEVKQEVSEKVHNMRVTSMLTVSIEGLSSVDQETIIYMDYDKNALEASMNGEKGAILFENGAYVGKGFYALLPQSDIESHFNTFMMAPYVWNLSAVLETSLNSNTESLKNMDVKMDLQPVLKKIQKNLVSEVYEDISDGTITISLPTALEATVKAKVQGQSVTYRYTYDTLNYAYTDYLLQGVRQKTTCVIEMAGQSIKMDIADFEGYEYNVPYDSTYF